MTITEIPVELSLPPSTGRSEGTHVSGIIRCLATELGILTPDVTEELSLSDVREIKDPTAILRILLGLAWEEKYISLIGDVDDHPREMELQGVYMTHDGESVSCVLGCNHYMLVCHEVKCTWKSARTVASALEQQHMWMWQIKAYCKALNTRFAMLHVLFVCGDYSYPIKPTLRKWLLEFTQEEIDQNWEMLMQYKTYREAQ